MAGWIIVPNSPLPWNRILHPHPLPRNFEVTLTVALAMLLSMISITWVDEM